MNILMVFYVLGWIMVCEGTLMVLPLVVSQIYAEYPSVNAFAISIIVCIVLGAVLMIRRPKDRTMRLREGFVVTALSWIVMSIMGSLPFIITGAISDPICAVFETVSGFSTTGASILSDVESLPKGILFWRSFTHWIGGMGVLVFLLAIKPLTGRNRGSGVNLMKAESPGPQVGKLVPKIQSTARILYGIYIFMTVLEIIFLFIGKMPLFDAVTTAFGTAGTGGFGIKNDSIAGYSIYNQVIVTIFMILFGVNFTFYFMLLKRKVLNAVSMEEIRWYFGIITAAVIVITISIRGLYPSIGIAMHQAVFQVGSIITTTGFATTDFNLWPQVSRTILVILMFVGACAGSTGGGFKISRVIILFKSVRKEFKQYLHPQSVAKITIDKKAVPHEVVRAVNVFAVTYILIFVISVLLIAFDGHDLVTNFTAVASTLNNIGPGLEMVGPTQNFGLFSNGAKLVLIFDMLAGRLELFPLLLLLRRETWKKF